MEKTYIAIDLKSFYASVECRERGLNPLDANLVVADASRTEKTICLAVSPSLKSIGVPGRPRLFEVVQKVRAENARRRRAAGPKGFTGKSTSLEELKKNPTLELDYIIAKPRMAYYIDYSTKIYNIYLKYVAPEDIHVYSIDEVFMDVTHYLKTYNMSPYELTMTIVRDVLNETGITATAGIGTNLYLAKIAMDIVAKHAEPDEFGVRVGILDEMSYRYELWNHTPITDFWRIGAGYSRKLAANGMYTMGDVARCSVGGPRERYNSELLFKLFGVNAELLIDHAWGRESAEISDIKAYRPENNSLSSGQVLQRPYKFDEARLVAWEMTDALTLDLVDKGLVTDQIVLTIGYDTENLADPEKARDYKGEVKIDHYGKRIPKHAHGTKNLGSYSSSSRLICEKAMELFDEIVNQDFTIRRLNVVANHILTETKAAAQALEEEKAGQQLSFFENYEEKKEEEKLSEADLEKEKNLQKALIDIKKKYGKNAMLKGSNFLDGATARERNGQIGGHKA